MGLATLFRSGYRSANPAVRREAVKTLTDETTLVALASHDPDLEVRLLTVERIPSETGLRTVALQGEYIDARLKAVRRIQNPRLLADIMRRRKHPDLMLACFEGIRDQAVLTQIAGDVRQSLTARRIAINMFADQGLLLELLETIREPGLRRTAIEKLSDPDLRRRLQHEAASQSRRGRIDRILAGHDPLLVVEMLGAFRDSLAAVRALAKLVAGGGEAGERATEILTRQLKHAKPAIRLEALHGLIPTQSISGDALAELAESDPDPRIRSEAAAFLAGSRREAP